MAATDDRQNLFLRGTLDMCLLALLSQRPGHVYELVSRLEDAGIADVGFGTLYPLVTRLRRQGLLHETTEASSSGPPRKVFSPSPAGLRTLQSWASQWYARTEIVRTLLLATGTAPTTQESR